MSMPAARSLWMRGLDVVLIAVDTTAPERHLQTRTRRSTGIGSLDTVERNLSAQHGVADFGRELLIREEHSRTGIQIAVPSGVPGHNQITLACLSTGNQQVDARA